MRREDTVKIHGFRYQAVAGKPLGLPYCTRCDTIDAKLIRLLQTTTEIGRKYVCPECEADFGLGLHAFAYLKSGTHFGTKPRER